MILDLTLKTKGIMIKNIGGRKMAEEHNPLNTRFCDMFGLEYPIAAFTHCPDTVYEVCNAGGIGILGISGAGFGEKSMAEEVEESIKLIKAHT